MREQRQREAGEHRRVGRDEQAAERDAGQGDEGEAGEPADARPVEPARDERHDHRGRRAWISGSGRRIQNGASEPISVESRRIQPISGGFE